jgi:transposase
MTSQHIIGVQSCVEGEQPEGIIVPLDLPELKLLNQEVQTDGSIEVHVIARRTREACPRCSKLCVKVHDTRMRVKRDIRLRNYQVRLVLSTRRFRCLACKRSFTETDTMCGRYKRTTKRLREHLAKQALQQPIAHVAEAEDVGPRFVQECFESLIQETCVKEGRT